MSLVAGRAYDVTVTALVPGYRVQHLSVTPTGTSVQRDIALQIDANACTAPGYARSYAYRESFEASDGGWTGSGTASWAWGKPTSGPGAAHSGARVWATNLAGNYGNDEAGDLISPVIDLSRYAGQRPVITWSQWLRTATDRYGATTRYDPVTVDVSGDYGTTWTTVYGPLYGDVDLAWAEKFVVLSDAYAGPGFRLRFRFSSNDYAQAPGWYIDDVGITVLQVDPAVVYAEDFEAGPGGYGGGGTSSTWAWGAPTSGPGSAHSGTKAWATNLAGNHASGEDSALASRAIDLSANTGQWAVVSWWQWVQTVRDSDTWGGWGTAAVDATADGVAWTPVVGPVQGNVDLAWARRAVALSPSYASTRAQVRFRLRGSSSPTALGVYVDDVVIQMGSIPCRVAVAKADPDPVLNASVVHGSVTDGSGQGWPLYARVDIPGRSLPVFSDPVTGEYLVRLEMGQSHDMTVTALVPGYRVQHLSVTPTGTSVQRDIALQIDANACTAPGYARSYAYRESFEASDGGWTGSGTASWAWGKPTSGPGAAHSGARVWATSLTGNYGSNEAGDLISPVIDLSHYAGQRPVITWSQWLRTATDKYGVTLRYDPATVDVSGDYGTTWTTVYGPLYGDVDLAWAEKFVVLSDAYAGPGFRLRFRFSSNDYAQAPGWYIDDVGITVLQVDPAVVYAEDFESGPGGYGGGGTSSTWAWGEPTSGPGYAHSGTKAWATNLAGNHASSEDSALASRTIDLSAHAGKWPVVSWWQWVQTARDYDYWGGWGTAGVDVTPDGRAWTPVVGPVQGNVDLAWAQRSVALSPSYASTGAQVRFRLRGSSSPTTPGVYIDDVVVQMGSVPCTPLTGGLVVGHVTDVWSGRGLAGARVTGGHPSDATTAIVEPLDPDNGDGVFVLFSSATGAVGLTASAAGRASAMRSVDVPTSGIATVAFALDEDIYRRYLAEGATSTFFDTRLALFNPGTTATSATLTFSRVTGAPVTSTVAVPAHTRVTVNPKTIAGLGTAEFSTKVESDQLLVVDRTLSWDARGYGAHAETAVAAPALTWYLAEGATHSSLNLFYLLQNPNATAAQVRVKYLRPIGAPLEKTYALPATSRTNIWVDVEDFPGLGLALAGTDVSAVIEVLNGQPIIVERALYADVPGQTFGAGHESAGVTTPSTEWFLAEGATGPYLDLFVLLANPNDTAAQIEATYLLPSGATVVKTYTVNANSRFNIWVDYDDVRLADTAVSTTVRSLNGVPIIVERAMWWPDGAWHEAHNSPGATTTGTRWALAEGEVNASRNLDTYILVANTSLAPADVRVTLWFEDGTSAERTFTGIASRSRFNVDVAAEFPQAAGRRFGAVVDSLGASPAQIVVERAMYWDAAGQTWAAGTNALATKLQ